MKYPHEGEPVGYLEGVQGRGKNINKGWEPGNSTKHSGNSKAVWLSHRLSG